MLKLKRDSSGQPCRFKARLVAQGYGLTKGRDYDDSFSSTPRFTAVRLLIAASVQHSLELSHYDWDTAFLYGVFQGDFYMEQPEGFFDENHLTFVCKLIKGLYGHPVSGRLWQRLCRKSLVALGFTPCLSEENLYSKTTEHGPLFALVYVDDCILATSHPSQKTIFSESLKEKFSIKCLGRLEHFLGVRVTHNADGSITLDQEAYVKRLLKTFNMEDCKPTSTPMAPNLVLSKSHCPSTPEELQEMKLIPYRKAVGSLMYLSVATRPDITTAVGMCCKFMQSPGIHHWLHGVKHIFRYLSNCAALGLTYTRSSSQLVGWVDSSWADDADNGRSRAGFVLTWASCAIC